MILPIKASAWQVLRVLARAGKQFPTGRDLRLEPTRYTKDGTFLTKLVDSGLIRVVKPNDDPFQATYALTPKGEHAAEYGEYDYELPKG